MRWDMIIKQKKRNLIFCSKDDYFIITICYMMNPIKSLILDRRKRFLKDLKGVDYEC